LKYTMKALDIIYLPGYKYNKTGVMVMDLIPAEQLQLNLFDNQGEKGQSVMKAVDGINKLFGEEVVRTATQTFNRKWKLKQNHLSQRYTTRLNELMIVKAG